MSCDVSFGWNHKEFAETVFDRARRYLRIMVHSDKVFFTQKNRKWFFLSCFLAVALLVAFFCDRLKDHHSVIPFVLQGLSALVSSVKNRGSWHWTWQFSAILCESKWTVVLHVPLNRRWCLNCRQMDCTQYFAPYSERSTCRLWFSPTEGNFTRC